MGSISPLTIKLQTTWSSNRKLSEGTARGMSSFDLGLWNFSNGCNISNLGWSSEPSIVWSSV
eukprot:m.231701 g.231701  ORF g.231701 m.231701 type:complete len:62 (-) comp54278_c5_seq6:1880-2065(-)